jgi:hypothetical protein
LLKLKKNKFDSKRFIIILSVVQFVVYVLNAFERTTSSTYYTPITKRETRTSLIFSS